MMAFLLRVVLLGFAVFSATAFTFPETAPIRGYGFTNSLPEIKFAEPVMVTAPPRETNRLFIVEKAGRIQVIPNLQNPEPKLFLQLPQTWAQTTEAGLLGMAFHPSYPANGRFFIFRTVKRNGLRCELAEYRVSTDPNRADPDSERVLISQLDDSDTHNAGEVKFGPDGYLYLSLGDELPAFDDRHETPQAIDRGFFAGIIRIDVDGRETSLRPNPHPAVVGNYWVPEDNPFIGMQAFNGEILNPAKVRTEFYAIGLRNPWRFTFDPATYDLICAEVGGAYREEINLIRKGGNYGWPYLEGRIEHNPNHTESFDAPLYEYEHGVGNFEGSAVIGGVVVQNASLGTAYGQYIFSDIETGNVWALDTRARSTNATWLTARRGIGSFAIDPRDGGVLAANVFSGKIEKLVYRTEAETGIPERLSELGLFEDLPSLKLNNALVPYEVINPLWSDGAQKQRWVSLDQAHGKIGFAATKPWRFPNGAYWVKHFELQLTNGRPDSVHRLETRVLVKSADGIYGLSYRWGNSLNDATLLPPYATNETFMVNDGGIIRTQVWTYPGWEQCRTCHVEASGGALSFNTYQLNRSSDRLGQGTNQLEWLAAHNFFEDSSAVQPQWLPNLSSLTDNTAPLQHKVRSYLFSNCSHCHQPGNVLMGPVWDGRISIPLSQAKIVNSPSFHYPDPMRLITPHDEENSYILQRASIRVPGFQMPPIATSEIDTNLVSILKDWIGTIPDDTWQFADVGETRAEGSAEQKGNSLKVSSAADGLTGDSFFYAYREVSGTAELVGHITMIQAGDQGEAGLMFRDEPGADGAFSALYVKNGLLYFKTRNSRGVGTFETHSLGSSLPLWLKLLRSGEDVSAWTSNDGQQWQSISVQKVSLSAHFCGGAFAASGEPAVKFAAADFDILSLNALNFAATAPHDFADPLNLLGNVEAVSLTNLQVSYFVDDRLIASRSEMPFTASWANPRSGPVQLRAVLESKYGAITSSLVALEIQAPPAKYWTMSDDKKTQGDWQAEYGSEAYLIPGFATNNSPSLDITVLQGTAATNAITNDPMALQMEGERINAALLGNSGIVITFKSADRMPHRAALYFYDWLGLGPNLAVSFSMNGMDYHNLRTVDAHSGVYVNLAFRGEVQVRIENPTGPAYLSAAFIDPVEDVAVSIVSPEETIELQQPSEVEIEVEAIAPGRGVARVELYDRGEMIAQSESAPYKFSLGELYAGEHQITAKAYGSFGLSGVSEARIVSIIPVESAANFIGADRSTLGNWKRRYGNVAVWTIGDGSQIPRSVSVETKNGYPYVFSSPSNDPRALEQFDGDSRMAACLFGSGEFTFTVNVLDGNSKAVGFYFLDWDNNGRIMKIKSLDAEGTVLDERTLDQFAGGVYLFWNVRGTVSFNFSSASINPVISGFFVDESLTPFDLWRNLTFSREEAQNGVEFAASDFDADGFSNILEYALGFDAKLAEDRPQWDWFLLEGELRARLTRRVVREDATPVIELSSNLRDWQPITNGPVSGGDLGVGIPMTQSSQFLRIGVLRTP